MVQNPERMSLCMMIESIEFLAVVQKMTECTHSFLFCGRGEDRACFRVDIYGWCNVAHTKRTLHIKYPNMASGTMVLQYT